MDSIFLLEEGDRAALLEQIMQALGCVYICLRAYFSPPYNCLKGLDGIYHEGRNQQTTSHGSFVRRLFDVYREASTYVDAGLIPGIAFASNNPFMKLELHEFQSLISSDFQLQFYQEAGIKTVVLMGCATGELELGMLDNHNQVDIEAEMKNILQTHFPNQPPSSSSSSLLSVSVDNSPEYPPLLFNIPIPTTTTAPPPPFLPQETLIREPPTTTTTATDATHDQTRQMLNQFRHAHFPSIECEDAAMTNAILAVLSSPSTSTSSHRPPTTPNISTAFRAYQPNSPARRRSAAPAPSRFKRAMMFFNNLNHHRIRHDQSLPTATQLHHMISERKRREKLNESFQILRSFLPPGTKKDKASVLSSTVEYMSSLKSRVAELAEQNQILESRIGSVKKSESGGDEIGNGERVSVEISPSSSSSSSTSEARFLDLRVRVRGESNLLDLVSRVIEFLRGQSGVSLTSVESNTRMLDSVSVHVVIIRLKIQGDEFDESGFREGVKRAVDDQPN
ncbi:putative transcription factor bHLH041 [Salvia hispanica]|uniref:putative transcription factor bHLH041 n=1 Tax=Salvia hispanica TaxID=49212 RepID=UPI002009AC61|nr:putative transcription factor bHLH041 [Salvia hispanica]